MSRPVQLALIQQHAGPDTAENLKRGIAAFEEAARQGATVVAYAELAFTPFYPQNPTDGNHKRLAEPVPGPTTELFMELARKHKIVTILNLFEEYNGLTYDSSPVIDNDGTLLGTTRMIHILEAPHFHEQGYYAPGPSQPVVHKTAVGNIGVAICYDRHYPEYTRQMALEGAELVIVPQAGSVGEWPEGLFEAEMRVAAFQNGYFAALCNRVGAEEHLTFEGRSFVVAPDGAILNQAPAARDAILLTEIDLDKTWDSNARRHFLQDRRPKIYRQWAEKISD